MTPSQRKYKTSEEVDFVIIGSGAAGGVLAKELATNGFRVVVLEQGPYLTEADFIHDEVKVLKENLLMNHPELQPNTFRKTVKEKAVPHRAVAYGRCVGGSSVHFTANYWRFHEIDFVERSKVGAIPGNRIGRLADHVCRPGAVLHKSGMGNRRFGTGGCEPV
jgi:choline dehydrogenase-like flavoprotein